MTLKRHISYGTICYSSSIQHMTQVKSRSYLPSTNTLSGLANNHRVALQKMIWLLV